MDIGKLANAKCRKCRQLIFVANEITGDFFKNAHGNQETSDQQCSTLQQTLIYLNEEVLPEWIQKELQTGNWGKGKLRCTSCEAHVGSYDFVSGLKCNCEDFVLPGVNIILSKRFKFCGDADCPDWVLAEINDLSKLSSIKLKLLTQVVAQGVINPPIKYENVEKIFADSKIDSNIDIKAIVACISYVITSTVRYGCDHTAMHSELQQLGLPREHSTAIKKIVDELSSQIEAKLRSTSLKINNLEEVTAENDATENSVKLHLNIAGQEETVLATRQSVKTMLENLKSIRTKMVEIDKANYFN